MKIILAVLVSVLELSTAQASDSAECKVLFNDAVVSTETVMHQDYDVKINGKYSYRTYARDEFYDLKYNYITTSYLPSYKLEVQLNGDERTYTGSSVGTDDRYSVSVSLIDHEGHKIVVMCQVL